MIVDKKLWQIEISCIKKWALMKKIFFWFMDWENLINKTCNNLICILKFVSKSLQVISTNLIEHDKSKNWNFLQQKLRTNEK